MTRERVVDEAVRRVNGKLPPHVLSMIYEVHTGPAPWRDVGGYVLSEICAEFLRILIEAA